MISINPVREKDAAEDVKAIYEDIKQSLKISWTPAIFQAFAMYPPFLQFIWHQLKPSVLTEQFYNDCDRARGFAETYVTEAHISNYKHEDALANDLSINDLVHIQTGLQALNYANPKLLLISGILNRAIGGLSIGGNGDTTPAHDNFGENVIRKIDINLLEEDEVPDEVKIIYQDIKSTLNIPLISTEYKAMANWPGFLKLAWEDIKLFMVWPSYSEGKEALLEFARHAANDFAYPMKMGRDEMELAGVHEEDFDHIEDMIMFFAGLIPGITLNTVEMRLVVEDLLEVERGEFAA